MRKAFLIRGRWGAAFAALLSLLTVAASPKPPFTLEGTVTVRGSWTALTGATVWLVQSERTVETDSRGIFSFGEFQVTGPDQLVISSPGYRTVTLALGALPAGSWRLDITMVASEATVDATPEAGQAP